jgi:uncharacterized membrane protein YfcA
MYFLILFLVIFLSVICVVYMLYKLLSGKDLYPIQSFKHNCTLACTGVVAFIADTIGVGSFAINIAIGKTLKLVTDKELPGFVNGAQVIPGAIEAIFFLGVLHVDMRTLVVLVLATTLGGFVGGVFASKIRASTIRVIMVFAFILVLFLLLSKLLNFLPIGGALTKLQGWRLWVGFVGMFTAGFLVSFGVGLFALVQAILFLLGMSPVVAFPIMTAAGAIQQPVTTFAFLVNNAIPIKKVLIVSSFGIVGVFIGFQIITVLSVDQLQWLLVIIIAYNIISLARSFIIQK